jgi:hypothetical protein
MHVCATLRSAATRLREKILKKTLKISTEEKSQSRYISRMRGGAFIQPIAMEVATWVYVPNVINRGSLCGFRWRGLVSAKGRL